MVACGGGTRGKTRAKKTAAAASPWKKNGESPAKANDENMVNCFNISETKTPKKRKMKKKRETHFCQNLFYLSAQKWIRSLWFYTKIAILKGIMKVLMAESCDG